MVLKWKKESGSAVQAPISHGGDAHDYVISHREGQHNVSYRPSGKHEHVGTFATEKEAKTAAEAHARGERKPKVKIVGPSFQRRGAATRERSRTRTPRGKSPVRLDREIAESLQARGEPQLAALFADPEATKTFVEEMRKAIYKKHAAEKGAAALAARPYTVKHLEQMGSRRMRSLLARVATEAEARARADQVGGWVEYEGRVIYGTEKQSDPAPES